MMMRRVQQERVFFKLLLLLLFSSMLGHGACGESLEEPLRVSSSGLLNNTFVYDGREVVYSGEAVGDVMERGDYAWVNVNDGNYAVGVYAPSELLKELTVLGDYNHRGDMIEVTGVFHRACREHGGDFDIHAKSVRLVARGYTDEHPLNAPQVVFTLLLLVSTVPLSMIYARIKNGSEKQASS